jgi:hypothetical protein
LTISGCANPARSADPTWLSCAFTCARDAVLPESGEAGHICGTIIEVFGVGETKKLSLFRRRPDGRLGGRKSYRRVGSSQRTAAIAVVGCALCFFSGVAAIADTPQAEDNRGTPTHRIAVLSSPERATVSWQVRTGGPTRLRLYHSAPSGLDRLVGEVTTDQGVETFEIVDTQRPVGSSVYQIRAVGFNGDERVLGTVLCVESGFSDQPTTFHWERSGMDIGATPTPRYFRPSVGVFCHGTKPLSSRITLRPDPPVPRPDRCSNV